MYKISIQCINTINLHLIENKYICVISTLISIKEIALSNKYNINTVQE